MIAGLLMLQSLTATPPPPQDDIVVTGQRPKDPLANTVEDVIVSRSIKALAADSIAELLAKLRARYGDDDLSVIVNGRRLGSIDAVAELPPEALTRIEVLKPGNGGQFGYSGTAKVLNLVLRPKFDSVTVEATAGTTTEGGGDTENSTGRYARIRNNKRFNGSIVVRRAGGLREDQRAGASATVSDQPSDALSSSYRNLLPSSREATFAAGLALPVRTSNLDLNVVMGGTKTQFLSGLFQPAADAAADNGQAVVYSLRSGSKYVRSSATLGGTRRGMFWSVLVNGDVSESDVDTVPDRTMAFASGEVLGSGLPSAPANRSTTSRTTNLALKATLSGSVVRLPAGDVRLGTNVSLANTRLTSVVGPSAEGTAKNRYRSTAIQANADIPLINRDVTGLAWIGSALLNVSAEYNRVSGLPDAVSAQGTLNWSLSRSVSFSLSKDYRETPPAIVQLYAPVILRTGVLIYDSRNDIIAPVTLITGGNTNIRKTSVSADTVQLSISGNPDRVRLSGSIAYANTRTDNPLLSFGNPSVLVEESFPALFVRDTEGRLVRYDARPFSAVAENVGRVSSDLHLSGSFAGDAREGDGPPNRINAGAWDVAIRYDLTLRNNVLLQQGYPNLDVLKTPLNIAPNALSRHRINIQAALTSAGYGLTLSGSWQNGFRGAALEDAQSPLRFSSLALINAEAFMEFGKASDEANPSKVRIKLAVDNLLNRRIRNLSIGQIDDRRLNGWLLDPLGRVVRLAARKVF